jgi:hypothetical protein
VKLDVVGEARLAADVDRGLQIVGEMKMLEQELAAIEARLEAAGLNGDQVELADPEREGRQFLARGSHAVVPVIFTADLLVKSFQVESDTHNAIIRALGPEKWDKFREFFRTIRICKTLFDNGKIFRAKAAEILGPVLAPKFISACLQRDKDRIPKSQVKIDWSRATAIAPESSERGERDARQSREGSGERGGRLANESEVAS